MTFKSVSNLSDAKTHLFVWFGVFLFLCCWGLVCLFVLRTKMIYSLPHNAKKTFIFTLTILKLHFWGWTPQWWQDHESWLISVQSFSSWCVKALDPNQGTYV